MQTIGGSLTRRVLCKLLKDLSLHKVNSGVSESARHHVNYDKSLRYVGLLLALPTP